MYSSSSSENIVQNGGAGIKNQIPGGTEDKISIAAGLYSTNYKTETDALKTGVAHVDVSTHGAHNVVLTDAFSILQACIVEQES